MSDSPIHGGPRTRPLGLVLTGTVSRAKGINIQLVQAAIRDGRLPAYTVSSSGKTIYLIRMEDADVLWPDPLPDLPEHELPTFS